MATLQLEKQPKIKPTCQSLAILDWISVEIIKVNVMCLSNFMLCVKFLVFEIIKLIFVVQI